MITEDEHDLSAPVVVGREVSTLEVKIAEDETTWFQKFLSRFRWIKDKETHFSLWNELINIGEITCLPLSCYHFSFLPPLRRHFQKYLLY